MWNPLRRRSRGTLLSVLLPLVGALTLVATPQAHAAPEFDRQAAVRWALDNVDSAPRYDNDCTWFVSQALWAGGLPKTDDWTDYSLNKKAADRDVFGGPTWPAVSADHLKNYLIDSGTAAIRELNWRVNPVPDAQIGDLIGYDWAEPKPDGKLDHVMIVTNIASGQYPELTGHSLAVRNQGWTWSQAANNWIEHAYSNNGNAPRVYLLHITR